VRIAAGSAISGTAGAIEFQFNPGGLTTQAASLQILNFTSDGTLAGTPAISGDVSGTLPATLTFDNGAFLNDYFEGFTFGTSMTFKVSLYGPALSAPDGVATAESAFAFSMFSDAAGTTPALTTNVDGFAVNVDVNLNGTTTLTNFSRETSVAAEAAAVPEPGSLVLLATAATGFALLRRRRLI